MGIVFIVRRRRPEGAVGDFGGFRFSGERIDHDGIGAQHDVVQVRTDELVRQVSLAEQQYLGIAVGRQDPWIPLLHRW